MIYVLTVDHAPLRRASPGGRPWAARIVGRSSRWGLEREFVEPLSDWSDAHLTRSGNIYGLRSSFPLREGELYEYIEPTGKYPGRKYAIPVDGELKHFTKEEALAWLDENSSE